MRDVYATYYKDLNAKMKVVYNGFDLEDFENFTIDVIKNEKLHIFYAGSFYGGARSPLPLFRLLDIVFEKELISPDRVQVNIAGTLEPELRTQIEQYKSSTCLNFMGKLQRSKALEMLTKSTLLWLIVTKDITHYTGVPLKMYEYMAARRPIINFAPNKSEPSAIIIENKLGWNFDEDEDSMNTMVMRFQEIITSFNNNTLSESLSDQILKKYSRKDQTFQVEKLFND
jgi:glycosyltransferase involved in cell wall biosynthesis